MTKKQYIFKSFINAAGVFVYVSGVAWLAFNSQHIPNQKDSFLDPLFVLLLLIISACVTGLLVLGKPIQLYLNGLKKEAFVLLFSTLAWLVVFLSVVAVALLPK